MSTTQADSSSSSSTAAPPRTAAAAAEAAALPEDEQDLLNNNGGGEGSTTLIPVLPFQPKPVIGKDTLSSSTNGDHHHHRHQQNDDDDNNNGTVNSDNNPYFLSSEPSSVSADDEGDVQAPHPVHYPLTHRQLDNNNNNSSSNNMYYNRNKVPSSSYNPPSSVTSSEDELQYSEEDSTNQFRQPQQGQGGFAANAGTGQQRPSFIPPNNRRQQQQQRRLVSERPYTPTILSSPGNTSLSSWENSPATKSNKKVLLQFVMPESKYARQARLQQQRQQQQQQQSPAAVVSADRNTAATTSHDGSAAATAAAAAAVAAVLSAPDSEADLEPQQQRHHDVTLMPVLLDHYSEAPNNSNGAAEGSRAAAQPPPPPAIIPKQRRQNNNNPHHVYSSIIGGKQQRHYHHHLDNNESTTASSISDDDHNNNRRDRTDESDEGHRGGQGGKMRNNGQHDSVSATTTVHLSAMSSAAPPQYQQYASTDDGDDTTEDGLYSLPSTMMLAANGSSHYSNNHNNLGQHRLSSSVDDSVVMTFSSSEGGDDGMVGESQYSDQPLDWEIQHSADDERTGEDDDADNGISKPPRSKRTRIMAHGHKRTRSGDGVAATLLTGGNDWKGMEQDNIPFPEAEDDETTIEGAGARNRAQRHTRRYHREHMELDADTGALYARSPKLDLGRDIAAPNFGNPQVSHPLTTSAYGSPTEDQMLQQRQDSFHGSGSNHSSSQRPIIEAEDCTDSDAESEEYDDEDDPVSIQRNRMTFDGRFKGSIQSVEELDELEHLFEDKNMRGTNQAIMRPRRSLSDSPFANIGKKSAEKAPRAAFLPRAFDDNPKYPTFICPRCRTRQREYFTVENAAGGQGPGSYLALYFFIYVMCSLFIFGLEEGWMPLDCVYFSVVTLTTAGLGDFVPTSDANKIICSIFIYFGVANIGLLLGSYIAGMLDDRARSDRREKQIESCPNCARIKTMKEAVAKREKEEMMSSLSNVHSSGKKTICMSERPSKYVAEHHSAVYSSGHDHHHERHNHHHHHHHHHQHQQTPKSNQGSFDDEMRSPFLNSGSFQYDQEGHLVSPHDPQLGIIGQSNSRMQRLLLGSPVTRQILGRQKHTRHSSFDINSLNPLLATGAPQTTYGATPVRRFSEEKPAYQWEQEGKGMGRHELRRIDSGDNIPDGFSETDEYSSSNMSSSSSSVSSTDDIWDNRKSRLQAAKYVFLTLRRALLNSMVIIAVGCLGFHLIEDFSIVDAWYFTTVFLTTVGYGDIVPVTKGGKLFATCYILIAGTILLNNMSNISMIPLELRKRRIERAILTQFGDHLDDDALRELATGPVIQRLRLSANRADGLDECTREMFSLAMLVRLGKVTEQDIKETFASFRHLDKHNEGVLNSKSIIAGIIAKQRRRDEEVQQTAGLATAPPPPPPPPPPQLSNMDSTVSEQEADLRRYWFGRQGSLHVSAGDRRYHFHPPDAGLSNDIMIPEGQQPTRSELEATTPEYVPSSSEDEEDNDIHSV